MTTKETKLLAKTGTCQSCGYEKVHCICNRNNQAGTIYGRNTHGETQKYQHYQNYQETGNDQYAETSRINRGSSEEKFMEEFQPVNDELLSNYIARTAIATEKLIEHSMFKHIYGGRKPWPSHTSTRYCPVCTLCQFVNTLRATLISLSEIQDISLLKFEVHLSVRWQDSTFNIKPI